MNRILVDTNIFIYAFDESSQFHKQTVAILENEENDLFTSTKNISEFFSVCSKLNIDLHQTLDFYEDLKDNLIILKPSEDSLNIFETLIKKYKPRGNRVYDIEIVSVMLANNLNKIVTANVVDFKDITEIELIQIV